MNGTQVRGKRLVVAGLTLAASLVLTGCSGGFFGDGGGQSGGTGGGGTSGGGQSGGTTDEETGGSTTEGDSTVPDVEAIPADFPAAIPLIDAPVSFGLAMGTGWTVVFDVTDAEASYTEQSALLVGAGFTSMGDARSPAGSAGSYDGPGYTVQMTSSTDPEPNVLVVVQTK